MPRVDKLGWTCGCATGRKAACCTSAAGSTRAATGRDCCIATAGTIVVARLLIKRLSVRCTFVVLLIVVLLIDVLLIDVLLMLVTSPEFTRRA